MQERSIDCLCKCFKKLLQNVARLLPPWALYLLRPLSLWWLFLPLWKDSLGTEFPISLSIWCSRLVLVLVVGERWWERFDLVLWELILLIDLFFFILIVLSCLLLLLRIGLDCLVVTDSMLSSCIVCLSLLPLFSGFLFFFFVLDLFDLDDFDVVDFKDGDEIDLCGDCLFRSESPVKSDNVISTYSISLAELFSLLFSSSSNSSNFLILLCLRELFMTLYFCASRLDLRYKCCDCSLTTCSLTSCFFDIEN